MIFRPSVLLMDSGGFDVCDKHIYVPAMMMKSGEKTDIRQRFSSSADGLWLKMAGKAAEHLRKHEAYRSARLVYVAPAPILTQCRINVLADGKKLIMPTRGLREGFVILEPFTIPWKDLEYAVSFSGLEKYGRRLPEKEVSKQKIDLLISDAIAVDRNGLVVGDGNGFIDLTVALLAALGGLAPDALVCLVLPQGAVLDQDLSADPWDVAADLAVTGQGVFRFHGGSGNFRPVFWQQLSRRTVRKVRPLWYLYCSLKDAGLLEHSLKKD